MLSLNYAPTKKFLMMRFYVIIFVSGFLTILCFLNLLKAFEIQVFHISTLKYHCIHLRVALLAQDIKRKSAG